MFGFGKKTKKKRLMDAARLSVEQIIEGSGMPDNDPYWQDSYIAGFFYARSLEAVVYENEDQLDELCKDAWIEYWQSNYPLIASYIIHFSTLETDSDYDNELEVNQNIIEEFSRGQKAGRLSLMINIGRARSIDEGFQLAAFQADEAIEAGEVEAPTQRDYNHIVDVFFVRNNLFDRVNKKRNERLEELKEEFGE